MDLSEADIRMIGGIRNRSRAAKWVLLIFALKSLTYAGAAVLFGVHASRLAACILEGGPSGHPLALQVYIRPIVLAFFAVFYGMLCLSIRSDMKSDALILRLVDRASGYPPLP